MPNVNTGRRKADELPDAGSSNSRSLAPLPCLRPAPVQTLTPLEVMRLPRDQFHELIASFPVTQHQLRRAALQRVRLFDDEGVSNLLNAMEKAYRRQDRAAEEEANSQPLSEKKNCWRPAHWARECKRWGHTAWQAVRSCKWEDQQAQENVAQGSEPESE